MGGRGSRPDRGWRYHRSYQSPFHRIIHLGGERFDSHDHRPLRIGRGEEIGRARPRPVLLVALRSCSAPRVGSTTSNVRAAHSSPPRAIGSGGIYRSVASLSFIRLSRYIYLFHSLRAKFGNASRATSLNVSESSARARTIGE